MKGEPSQEEKYCQLGGRHTWPCTLVRKDISILYLCLSIFSNIFCVFNFCCFFPHFDSHVSVRICVPWHVCGCQRVIYERWLPSTFGVSGLENRPPDLAASPLSQLAHSGFTSIPFWTSLSRRRMPNLQHFHSLLVPLRQAFWLNLEPQRVPGMLLSLRTHRPAWGLPVHTARPSFPSGHMGPYACITSNCTCWSTSPPPPSHKFPTQVFHPNQTAWK